MNKFSQQILFRLLLFSFLESCYNPHLGLSKPTLPDVSYQESVLGEASLREGDNNQAPWPAQVGVEKQRTPSMSDTRSPDQEKPWGQQIVSLYSSDNSVSKPKREVQNVERVFPRSCQAVKLPIQLGCLNLGKTSLEVSPVSENLPFQARGGESVRFHYQQGQWCAEVSSRIGAASRRAVLPVVCSQGEDVASSLELLSKSPSWQRQRQIHVLGENVCPTLGEVVYVGELGLKGGGEGESSGSGAQEVSPPSLSRSSLDWLQEQLAAGKSPEEVYPLIGERLADPKKIFTRLDQIRLLTDCVRYGQVNAKGMAKKDAVIVLGNTGAGKSTFINYLAGCELEEKRVKGYGRVLVVKDQDSGGVRDEVMPIGHGRQSKTFMPHIVAVDERVYCDCPGFSDNRGAEINIANAVNIKQALSQANSIRIVVLVTYYSISVDRGNNFQELLRTLTDLLEGEAIIAKHKQSILFGISKCPDAMTREELWEDCLLDHVPEPLSFLEKCLFVFNPLTPEKGWDRAGCLAALDRLDKLADPSSILSVSLNDSDLYALHSLVDDMGEEIAAALSGGDLPAASARFRDLERLSVIDHEKIKSLLSSTRDRISIWIREQEGKFRCQYAMHDFTGAESLLSALREVVQSFGFSDLDLSSLRADLDSARDAYEAQQAQLSALEEELLFLREALSQNADIVESNHVEVLNLFEQQQEAISGQLKVQELAFGRLMELLEGQLRAQKASYAAKLKEMAVSHKSELSRREAEIRQEARLSAGEQAEALSALQKDLERRYQSEHQEQEVRHSQAVARLAAEKSSAESALNAEQGKLLAQQEKLLSDQTQAYEKLLGELRQKEGKKTKPQEGLAKLSAAEVRAQLVFYYSGADFPYVPSLFEEQDSKHVQDLECQLMLREKKLARQETKEASGDREDQVASHHMRLEEVKTPIALQDLFKARSVRPDKPIQAVHRILLTGDPGTGKTTVSKKLAYQWAKGAWGQEFHTLYLLPVRNLQKDRYNEDNYRKLNTLATAIVNNCFIPPSNEDEYKRLRDHIEEELKQPTTLVILDGLDERAGASEEILRQAQAGSHKLLMLSRPYGIETERQSVDIEIEHVGFNREQLEGYVRQEVSDSELAAALLSYIDKHTNVRSIAHVPVNLAILCALWQDASYGIDREGLQQGSFFGLYRLITEYTWRRYKERTSEGVSVQGRKDLFDKLGQIALAALEQGEVLISPGLIERTLSNSETDADEVKARCKDAGFLLLRSIDEKFYQFPHLTFQEYFAGCALARQLLSEKKKDERLLRKFISKHKYESQYGRTLTFMAGKVSRIGEFEGIQNLLGLLGKSDKEIVGVQHLLLQLRVLHEWLCLSDEDVEEDLAELSEEFKLHSCLEHWFDKAFGHIRREGYEAGSTGDKLLQLLVSSLATFGSVAVHAPDLLKPLKQAAQDYNVHVRRSALKSLGQLVSSSPSHVPSMRAILLRAAQDREADYVRPVGLEALGQVVAAAPGEVQSILDMLAQAAQEGDGYDRPGALAALGQVVAASPGHVLEVPETLLKATQDEHQAIRQAAVSALGQVAAAAPDKAPALLERLYQAAQDSNVDVRAAALKSLGQAIAAIPDKASGILEQLYQAAEDEYWSVRQAVASALGQVVVVAPHKAPVILDRLAQAAQDRDYDVRATACKSLSQAVATVPDKAPAILEQLYQAAQDSNENVRAAALKSLGEVVETTPRHASAMLETLLSALQDKDDDVRQAAVSALGQVAEAAPDKAPAILASLRQATQDEDADVRQVALHKLPLQELLEQYFTDPSTNSILIPHITARLCHTPLVIGKSSSGADYRQVILYATAGAPEIQNHPSDVVKDFVDRIASSSSQTDPRFPCQMGKPDWERYYGAVGEEPSLPDGLEAIMDSDCPFWPGNKVGDTHLLVLIPEQVADKPLTLDYLGELIKSPKGGGYGTKYRAYYAGDIGSQSPDSSYWVLMTRDVLPGSRWKSYQDQCALVADHANRTGLPYELPGALEAAVVMLLHHVRSGEFLYGPDPLTYTRCQERVRDFQLVVGGFSSGGLSVCNDCGDSSIHGVAGLRKF